MKIQVSSGVTLIYKYGFFSLWSFALLGSVTFASIATGELTPSIIFFGFAFLMILLAWIMIRKLREVSYDDKFVYLSDIRFNRKIELKSIHTINEGNILSFDPWFEIELYPVNGTIEKFDFMPEIHEHIAYSFFGKLSKKLIGFRRAVYNSKIENKTPIELSFGQG